MRIGKVVGGSDGGCLDAAIAEIVQAEKDGFASAWRPNIFGLDAITVLALAGEKTSTIELGTAVVPTYPRHPHSLAQQAVTASLATGGRFALGVGRSHQIVIETMFGLTYDKPVSHMRDYVSVLRQLLDGGSCSYEGVAYTVNASLETADHAPVPILIGALMPKMLELCGTLCEGTLTWMAGPKFVEEAVVPAIGRAAEAAGRPQPRVVVSLPVCVTDDEASARAFAAKAFEHYGYLPVYRACLDAEGAAGPADVCLAGTEDQVREGLGRVAAAGATDFYAAVFPETAGASTDRTDSFLASLSGRV